MRIPSLDGLRGISIVLVLIAHLAGTRYAPDLAWTRSFGDIGSLGVRMFFVISGFLMTVLVDVEEELTGRISLTQFLRRRALRILPAFATYVGVIAVASFAGLLTLESRDLLMSSTLTMNYDSQRSWYVGHLWSLSVEAQFYVCWAVVRVLAGRQRMLWVALAALAIGPAARIAIHVFVPAWRWSIGEAFPTVLDALATGGLLAILQGRLAGSDRYVRFLRSRVVAATPLALLALNAAMPHIAFSYTVGQTLLNGLLALLVHRLVMIPESAAGRVLNAWPVVSVGALSYSLYLWQQPFLNRQSVSSASAFPLNLALAIAAAILSYHLVERPALKLRSRIGKERVPATAHTANRRPAHAAVS